MSTRPPVDWLPTLANLLAARPELADVGYGSVVALGVGSA